MALTTPRIMSGVMELLPLDQIAFQTMLDTIRRNFERFGFLPIETPVMEYADVLLTKTGGETERQVYFVQSAGSLQQGDEPDLALRFDLTVPLARYVAEHERELHFPFRRYQIQRVYRGESAQRGRFREFYQCDIDVIGKDTLSIRHDAELPAVIYNVFRDLDIGSFTIQLNNRKIMRGFFEGLGILDTEQQTLILREVDKLDKRGAEYVRNTLIRTFHLPEKTAQEILEFIQIRSTTHEDALAQLEKLGKSTEMLNQGIQEMREVLSCIRLFGVPETHYSLNFSIARGLDYYTGTVFETMLNNYPQIGSICSGGRYENLAANYTKSHLPGVGISIGATRLFYQLREANLISKGQSTVKVLIIYMDDTFGSIYLELANQLRHAGINTEVFLEASKLGKQFKYADRAGIRFALVLGEEELAKETITLKDLRNGTQCEIPRENLICTLRNELEIVGDTAAT